MLRILVLILSLFFTSNVCAEPLIKKVLPGAKKVGSGEFTYLIWDVYDATLFSEGKVFRKDRPFALQIEYNIAIKGKVIATHSAKQIRRLGFRDEVKLAAWHQQMQRIFPNVVKGTLLTGVYRPNKPTLFYSGNKKIGTIGDPKFGEWFFEIWLSKRTADKKMRLSLLGLL